ncbi:MAG: hypothetical protein ABIR96_05215 [Bdellovibrionota bacterium]
MKNANLMSILALTTLSSLVLAREPSFDPVPLTVEVGVPVTATYIPKGFDSNDNAQIVVSGAYPNSCYKMGPTHVNDDKETHRVSIDVNAYYTSSSYCLMLYIPFTQTIDLGVLPAANYELEINKLNTQTLPVSVATRDQSDDYLYATIINVVRLSRDTFELRGILPSSCSQIAEVRVIEEVGNVLTVLPIVRFVPGCEPKEDPTQLEFAVNFKTRSDLSGSKLIYVRSLNGASVSQVANF